MAHCSYAHRSFSFRRDVWAGNPVGQRRRVRRCRFVPSREVSRLGCAVGSDTGALQHPNPPGPATSGGVHHTRPRKRWSRCIGQSHSHGDHRDSPEPTFSHRTLQKLAVKEIWTTNYDRLLETAIPEAAVIAGEDATHEIASQRRAIIKMHGSISARGHWEQAP